MTAVRLFLFIAMVSMNLDCASLSAQNIPDSCGVRDWFQFQEELTQSDHSLLCRGAMDFGFDHRTQAARELKEIIRKAPHSENALEAHQMLVSLYFRHGQYRAAIAQAEQGLRARPEAEDLKGIRSMLGLLAQYPDLRIVRRTGSAVQGEIHDGNLFAPLTIDGISGSYILDTGANVSLISESEAKRLGLAVHETATKMSDISGTPSGMRLAEAHDLWVGGIHLKNVAFAVFPDRNEPFVDLPEGRKGILGIPVLLAMGSICLEKNNRIILSNSQMTADGQSLPLAFDGQNPLVRIEFRATPLTFTLDTGADRTYLYKPFADAFPSLIQTGRRRQEKVTGVSGRSFQESVDVPSVRFSLAKGVEVELAPATVILSPTSAQSKWTAGNFGFDLLDKARPFTIDFRTMELRFP